MFTLKKMFTLCNFKTGAEFALIPQELKKKNKLGTMVVVFAGLGSSEMDQHTCNWKLRK